MLLRRYHKKAEQVDVETVKPESAKTPQAEPVKAKTTRKKA